MSGKRVMYTALLALAAWALLSACSDTAPLPDIYAQGSVPWQTTGGAAQVKDGTNYLSDLDILYATNGWGPLERDQSNGEAAAGDGRTLSIGGKTYQKGLGMHPAAGERDWAEAEYLLGGKCSSFSAEVGLDDEIDT